MPRRVLLLSARVGTGHITAAAALERSLARTPGVELLNLDVAEHTTWLHQMTYTSYFPMARIAPWLMDWGYLASHPPFATEPLLPIWDRLNAGALVRRICAFDPEVTICTHFMPARIIGQLFEERRLRTSLSVVVTDYDFHGIWLAPIFSRYFVALEETQAHCHALGLPRERVVASGIPVDPRLAEACDRAALLREYDLRDDAPTVLVSAGASGAGPTLRVVEQLMRVRRDLQAVVVCGRNDRLRRSVSALVAPQPGRFRVVGYSDAMHDLLRLATLFIGKPGGMAAAECMAAGLPMLLLDPLPGQEQRNCAHLLEEGVAMRCHELTTIAHKVERVLGEPGLLERMRSSAARFGRAGAAQQIVDLTLGSDMEPIRLGRVERRRIVAAARGRAPAVSGEGAS